MSVFHANNFLTYVQGHKFSNESDIFYNVDNAEFKNLSPYTKFNYNVETTIGSPIFESFGNHIGIKLDRSWQGRFIPAIPWGGTAIFTVRMERITLGPTFGCYPIIFGDAANESSNAILFSSFAGNEERLIMSAPSAKGSQYSDIGGEIKTIAWSFDNITGKSYMYDGNTVTEVVVDTSVFGALSLSVSGFYARIGDLIGDGTSTPVTDYNIHLFEQHYFNDNLILNDLDNLKKMVNSMNDYYN